MNHIRHPLSTLFFVAVVVGVCLSTDNLGIIASKSGFSITVPRAGSRVAESYRWVPEVEWDGRKLWMCQARANDGSMEE